MLHDADRILLWDPDILVDLASTRFALGPEQRLLDALDCADVVTAAAYRDNTSLIVFDGVECYAKAREGLGSGLIEPLQRERGPLTFAACGMYWMWLHVAALSRLAPPPPRPTLIAGIDVTLSRRLIEGGCGCRVDPRLAVISSWRSTAPWTLDPVVANAPSLPEESSP